MPPLWLGFSKQRKKPGWRRSSNCVQNAFVRLSPSGQNEKTPLRSNFAISVSCHLFGWALPSSAKSRLDEDRPIAFKTCFFDFRHRAKRKSTLGIEFYNFGFMPPFWVGFNKQRKKPGWRRSSNCVQNAFVRFLHRVETKKHPLDRILQFRFHATILGGLFQAAQKAGLTNIVQLRSKRVFSTFPIGAKRKNALGIEFYNVGSHATIFKWAFQVAQKAGLTKIVQLRSKRLCSTFPIGWKRKNPFSIEYNNFCFMPPFWVGFSKQRKKPGWRRSFNYVQNAFVRLSPSGRNEKTPLGSNFTISVSCHHFGCAFPSSVKSRVDEDRPIAFKTRFFDFPHGGETKKHPCDRILQFRFHATILGGLYQAAQKAGLTKNVQLRSKRVFSTFPIGAKRKKTIAIEFYNFGFMPPFWVGFSKQRKKPGWQRSSNCVQNRVSSTFPIGSKRKRTLSIEFTNFVFMPPFVVGFPKQRKKLGCRRTSNCVQNAFFRLSPPGRNEKTPLG